MAPSEAGNEIGRPDEASTSEHPFTVRFRATPDRVTLFLDCEGEIDDLDSVADLVVTRLKSFGLERPPNHHGVRRILQEASEGGRPLKDVVLVEGLAPTPSVDGRIDWAEDFFAEGFVYDESTDQIDYRKRAGQRNVKADQLLATLIEPVRGEAGKDFQGAKIPPRKPRRRRVRLGRNVRHDEASGTYYSEIEGRIRWSHGVLAVDDLYKIEGDAGLVTGDISHPGAVLVAHDVLAGTRIEAAGDVEVMGVVEAAHIQTGGALTVHGGITGAHGARIIVGGSITARYILDADVQAGGDITVDREILQSTIQTRGALRVRRGRIVGGKITALGGVIAANIGSDASVRTDIHVGEDYCLAGLLEIIHKKIAVTQANVIRIHNVIDPKLGKLEQLSQDKREMIETLAEQVALMESQLLELREEKLDLQEDSIAARNLNVIAIRQLCPEVYLFIGDDHFRCKNIYDGPVRLLKTSDGLRIARTSNLTLRRAKGDVAE